MKTLFILRHAKSSWKDDSLADHERPLNKRGHKDAQSMGKLMKKLEIEPDLILSSSACRARETARLATEKAGYSGKVQVRDEIYAFEPEPLLNVLINLDDKINSVMLVGHNPAMEELLAGITGEFCPLPTASLVQIQLPVSQWQKVSFGMQARIIGLWKPKELQTE
jgi:phosphohistidine phosphatase